MGIDFRRPRHIRGFRFGEVLVWDFTSRPLVEKTVSGSVVTFSDGADDVPLKSCAVTIAPTLDGVSSVKIEHTGKNLLDVSTAQGTGTIWFHYDNGIKLKKNTTYTLSCGNYGNGSIAFYGLDHTTQIAYAYITASSAKVTYTPTEDVIVCPRIYQSGLTVSGLIDVMLEVGTTATAYEPYVTPTTHTANLGRTVHGGSVDVVNGTGTDENVLVDMGTLTWTYHPAGSVYSDYFDCYLPSDSIKGTSGIAFNGYTDDYVSIPSNNIAKGTYTDGVMALASSSRRFIICDTRYTSAEALTTALQGKYLSYPLETPEDFTFTPVPIISRLGDNTMWGDGDLSVTYYAYAD